MLNFSSERKYVSLTLKQKKKKTILKNFFDQLQIIIIAQYLLKNYGRDTRVTELVDRTDIWLMPSLNPDGFEKASEGNCYQVGLSYLL